MDKRQITPTYFVAPQIDAADVVELARSGFTRLICNRPDVEVPPSHQYAAIEAAAAAAGLEIVYHPLTHTTMTPENVAKHRHLAETTSGPVLAYCASGTRCTIVWALGQAEALGVDEIIQAARQAGYDLANMRPMLETIASQRNSQDDT
ncbi:MAG: TIGR01244 family sulfur transferase [Paracoccaceae bacterium]